MNHRSPIAYIRKGKPLRVHGRCSGHRMGQGLQNDRRTSGGGGTQRRPRREISTDVRGQLHQRRVRTHQGPHRLGIQAGRRDPISYFTSAVADRDALIAALNRANHAMLKGKVLLLEGGGQLHRASRCEGVWWQLADPPPLRTSILRPPE